MDPFTNIIKEEAGKLGFSACGVAKVGFAASQADYLEQWLSAGHHAGMKYMENYRDIRLNPDRLVEGARSVISVALNYYPDEKQPEEAPRIAFYAYGKDYHRVLKEKLHKLETILTSLFPGQHSRCFVDSAPIPERYWAWRAGLGWIGKNGCLIIPGDEKGGGSFFFLGEIITTTVLRYDDPQEDRCGNCTRCLAACPTGALIKDKQVDANKCLSYLTIEHKGEIPGQEAGKIGNRLFGCDTCQSVCPWNRFAVPTKEEKFKPNSYLLNLQKEEIKTLTKEDYNRIFAGSAVKRAGYDGLMRTVHYLKD